MGLTKHSEFFIKATRSNFTQDYLIKAVKSAMSASLERFKVKEKSRAKISNLDCLLSGIAMFAFKYSSLLQFDTSSKEEPVQKNLRKLFGISQLPSDTRMREILDEIPPQICIKAYNKIFSLLQRGKILKNFEFFDGAYLISVDGTGMFSSKTVHCENCCIKEHKNGEKTYYHQGLTAAIVHPNQKVVIPLPYEPILKQDGIEKNDCEQNAFVRWIKQFRNDHFHLKTIILLDGLYAKGPTIDLLKKNNCDYMIVCREGDHKYLYEWFNAADANDAPEWSKKEEEVETIYKYMHNVPMNGQKDAPLVNVMKVVERSIDKERVNVWITNLPINGENIEFLSKGARTRWKIENEVHNTLKNQGYAFEHNFGHGNKYLNQVFAHLMLIAFLVDQCLQKLNKRFCMALEKCIRKSYLWRSMLRCLYSYLIPDFETLYESIFKPPNAIELPSVIEKN